MGYVTDTIFDFNKNYTYFYNFINVPIHNLVTAKNVQACTV